MTFDLYNFEEELNRKLKHAAKVMTDKKLASGEYVMYLGRPVPLQLLKDEGKDMKITSVEVSYGFFESGEENFREFESVTAAQNWVRGIGDDMFSWVTMEYWADAFDGSDQEYRYIIGRSDILEHIPLEKYTHGR